MELQAKEISQRLVDFYRTFSFKYSRIISFSNYKTINFGDKIKNDIVRAKSALRERNSCSVGRS